MVTWVVITRTVAVLGLVLVVLGVRLLGPGRLHKLLLGLLSMVYRSWCLFNLGFFPLFSLSYLLFSSYCFFLTFL
jgi:hypothetical protein